MNSITNLRPFSLFSEPITLTISPLLQKLGAVALAIFALYAIYSYFFSESLDQKRFDDMNRKLDNLDGRLNLLAHNLGTTLGFVTEIRETFLEVLEEELEKEELKRA